MAFTLLNDRYNSLQRLKNNGNQVIIGWGRVPKILWVLVIFCLGSTLKSQNPISEKSAIPSHPRILLLKNDEKAILSKIKSDSSLESIHKIILKECDKLLLVPVSERKLKGRRLLEVSREAYRRIFFLSYAWRTTQNQKYFTRAEKELLAVCSFTDWNPSHFLDVAEMTTAVSIGYDWLFNSLSAASKANIRKAIMTKGIKPSLDANNNSWLSAATNWNQVCNAGITLGALAVFEDDPKLCSELINRALSSIPKAMQEYGVDGNYPEGFGYWSYGTTYNVLLLSALEKVFQSDFGLTEKNGFMKTPYYMLHITGPSGLGFNYSDNAAKGNLNPAMFWFANRLNEPSLLYVEKKYLAINKNLHRVRELPALIIWGKANTLNNSTLPKQNIWVGLGANPVAVLRTSWKKENSIFIGLKAGSPYVNHGHMDVGEFVMDAWGERWAMDFDPQSYSTLEEKGIDLWSKKQTSSRWQLFRLNNNSHNTLTINGQQQLVNGYASIVQYSDKPEFLNAITDLTALYKTEIKKAQRGVAIINNKYVVVQDEIESGTTGAKVVWKMLTDAQVKVINSTTLELQQNNKKVTVKLVSPTGATLTTWSTKPKNDYEEQNLGTLLVGFEFNIPPGKKISSTVIISTESNTDFEKIKVLPLQAWPKN